MSDISNRRAGTEKQDSKEKNPFNIPLAELFMYFALAAIGLLFTGLIIAYVYASVQMDLTEIRVPNIFHANTVIILSSSLLLKVGAAFLQKEEYKEYAFSLFATFTLGIIFIFFQIIGWMELFQSGVTMQESPSGAYLYLISGLHLLHIFGGCVPLAIMAFNAYSANTDIVKELIFSTNPDRFHKFKLLSMYWHFIGILWLGIYFFFIILNITVA
ncbi:MAG: cytochrome c oxidase subunit 3 [Chitinophagales bacterium]